MSGQGFEPTRRHTHRCVPKIVATPGTARLCDPDFRLHYCDVGDQSLHCLPVPDPHTQTHPPDPAAHTRQAAWRGRPWRPMRALGVRSQANRSQGKTRGAEPEPLLAGTPVTPERPAAQTRLGPRCCSVVYLASLLFLIYFLASSLPPLIFRESQLFKRSIE